MQIIYIIGGLSPEYTGWLKTSAFNITSNQHLHKNSDRLRQITKRHVDHYMQPAGQKCRLYWAEIINESIHKVDRDLVQHQIPKYGKTNWFNTDVWTIRQALNHITINNRRCLKPLDFAKYLNHKYQLELRSLLKYPCNLKDQRFKRNFYNEWQLSSLTPKAIQRAIKMFSAYLLLRNLINSVPKGCRKMYRKLVPLKVDDLTYDIKLLDYKFHLNKLIQFKRRINSLSEKPFGTVEFTNQYLVKRVPFLQIFNSSNLKSDFNL